MGFIVDLDYPVAKTGAAARIRDGNRCPRIESDTPVVPGAVAMSVWAEACAWLDEELPREWVNRLAVRANVIYARNRRFRRSIRGRGNVGREYLWRFTRHWLAAMIRRHRYEWHARLPAAYNVGADLPPVATKSSSAARRSRGSR